MDNLDKLKKEMETAKQEFELATKCIVESLTGVHERLEHIESWIESLKKM